MSNDQGASEAAIRYRDLAWIELPLRRFSRRVQGKFVFGFRITVDLVLRDLMTDNSFDPVQLWDKEKTLEIEEERQESKQASKSSTKKGKKGKQSSNNKERFIDENKKRIEERDLARDMMQIETMNREGIVSLEGLSSKIRTDKGRLVWLLTILDYARVSDNRPLLYDVVWAIEADTCYKTGKLELRTEKDYLKEAKRRIKDEIKADKKNKRRSIDDELEALAVDRERLRSFIAHQIHSRKKVIKRTVKERDAEDIIAVQLTEMSDRLPPLSKFYGQGRLDDWQKQVLRWIDAGQNVIVSAPTSSGKTVIAAYVASLSKRRLTKDQEEEETKKRLDDDAMMMDADDSGAGGDDGNPDVVAIDEEVLFSPSSSSLIEDNNRVLFVVPTEPLVWQVGAHFMKMFQRFDIALVTSNFTYSPHMNKYSPPGIVVGTPLALETAMFRVRGDVVTYNERNNKSDQSLLPGGFDLYSWVVYDEIHALNGDEGAALQRLIRCIKCKFIALSATIGNAEDLRCWFERVKAEQVDVRLLNVAVTRASPDSQLSLDQLSVVDAEDNDDDDEEEEAPDSDVSEDERELLKSQAIRRAELRRTRELKQLMKKKEWQLEESKSVKKLKHDIRFINLQSHVWTSEGLTFLHPLAAVSMDLLLKDELESQSLPFTPRDSYDLWMALRSTFDRSQVLDVDPHVVFDATPSSRITLQDTKDYEDGLKRKLQELARLDEQKTATVLDRYTCPDSPIDFDITSLVLSLKERNMIPAVCFHLNTVEAIMLFKTCVAGLERRQQQKYPNYYRDMVHRQKEIDVKAEQALKQQLGASNASSAVSKLTGDERDDRRQQIASQANSGSQTIYREELDFTEPHEEFVMSPSVGLTRSEYESICDIVKKDDKIPKTRFHALLRGLRRGVGLMVRETSLRRYRWIVMKLATQGRLSVVFSDDSLAFGVNMPFRACVFCSDMGGLLTPLMAQQMAGRAGRRGLDTQGHFIYAGTSSSTIKTLMLGQIPAILGKECRFAFQSLPLSVSNYCNPPSFQTQLQVLGGITLSEHCSRRNNPESNPDDIGNFYNRSLFVMKQLNLVTDNNEPLLSKYQLHALYHMREYPSEAISIVLLLTSLYARFTKKATADSTDSTEAAQVDFIGHLLCVVDRKAAEPGHGMLDLPRIAGRPDLFNSMAGFMEEVNMVQGFVMDNIEDPVLRSSLLLPQQPVSALTPIDGLVFSCISDMSLAHSLTYQEKQHVLNGIFRLGDCLLHLHNCLYSDTGILGRMETLLRKSFSRLKYTAREIVHYGIDFPDESLAEGE